MKPIRCSEVVCGQLVRNWAAPLVATLALLTFTVGFSVGAPGNAAAGLAGVGAGAALGAGAGGAGTTSSSGAGGGSSAPIEVQIMAYKGLAEIAADLATLTERSLCELASPNATDVILAAPVEAKEPGKCLLRDQRAILLEDPTSALQIALYQSLVGYHDQLRALQSNLVDVFSLVVVPDSLTFTGAPDRGVPITLSALDSTVLTNLKIAAEGADAERFSLSSRMCAEVSAAKPRTVNVTFLPPEQSKTSQTYSAELKILSDAFKWNHSVKLKAIYTRPKAKPAVGGLEPPVTIVAGIQRNPLDSMIAPTVGAAITAPTAGAASASPLSLTYLSGIGTALAGIKAAISYSSSSAQPTTQSLQVLLENELWIRHIKPYTSTSVLDLSEASKASPAYWAGKNSAASEKSSDRRSGSTPSKQLGPRRSSASPKPDTPFLAWAKRHGDSPSAASSLTSTSSITKLWPRSCPRSAHLLISSAWPSCSMKAIGSSPQTRKLPERSLPCVRSPRDVTS